MIDNTNTTASHESLDKACPLREKWTKEGGLTNEEVDELFALQRMENQTPEERKRELFLYYSTKRTLTKEELHELLDLTFSDEKESERANFLWAKLEKKQ